MGRPRTAPRITQITIFHPNVGRSTQPGHTRQDENEQTADRQRYINLELERIQVDEHGVVREIVLGTNNFVYAVIDYPVDTVTDEMAK